MSNLDIVELWLVNFAGWLVWGGFAVGAVGIAICIFNPDLV